MSARSVQVVQHRRGGDPQLLALGGVRVLGHPDAGAVAAAVALDPAEFGELAQHPEDRRARQPGELGDVLQARHPMMRDIEHRQPAGGLPRADEVFERGMSLGMSHGTTDEELQHVVNSIHAFASTFAPANA